MHDLLVGAVIIVLIPIAVKFAVVRDNWTVAVLLAVMLLCQQWHSMLLQHEIHIVQQQVSDLLITLHSMD